MGLGALVTAGCTLGENCYPALGGRKVILEGDSKVEEVGNHQSKMAGFGVAPGKAFRRCTH